MNGILAKIMSIVILTLVIQSCDNNKESDLPSCIEEKISKIKQTDVANPPIQIWKWEVDGNTYFYITSDCCDQFNYLYNSNCEVVCAPDGGFTGNGDSNCPEFTEEITKTLVWQDPRE